MTSSFRRLTANWHDNVVDSVKKDPLSAVQSNWGSILYVKNPSLEVQLAAVRQHVWAIDFIKPAHIETFMEVFSIAIETERPSTANDPFAISDAIKFIENYMVNVWI